MKYVAILLLLCVNVVIFTGCQGKSETPATPSKTSESVSAADPSKGATALTAYLKALQNKDRQAAYTAVNLPLERLEECRQLIVNQPVKKLTEDQRITAEDMLRTSSSIELYLKRMPVILLKSASIEVIKSSPWSDKAPNVLVHEVKVTYANAKESLSDKNGKPIKEFVLRFNQIQHTDQGPFVQEFLIEDKDFENILNRKLDIKTYF